ncbi:MAG: ABC transporter ATP-binding protein [Candidatus Bathyarchaeia archaeon]
MHLEKSPILLQVRGLYKYYLVRGNILDRLLRRKARAVHAVDGVDFELYQGETLGIVGESGSGKTTLVRTILLLTTPTEGSIKFEEEEITKLPRSAMRHLRKQIQIVSQDPTASLDPRWRVKDIVSEPVRVIREDSEGLPDRVAETLRQVGIDPNDAHKFPHEFSGGQRQRIAIARALILKPKLVILDEPTSALDASVQAQILNLLRDLKKKFGLSYLFISHNVNVIKYMSNRIIVMYLGKVVEAGPARALLEHPSHPYTIALLSSVPRVNRNWKFGGESIRGEVTSNIKIPSGCRFHPRCPYAQDICKQKEPDLREITPGHNVSCHLAESVTK